MCKTKAEGGRCNGWFVKEIERLKMKQQENTQKSENIRQDTSLSDDEKEKKRATIRKQSDKNYQKIQDHIQAIKDKPIVEVPKNMTINDIKRERKKFAKVAEIYKKYDKDKYNQLLTNFGEQIRNNVIEPVIPEPLLNKVKDTGYSFYILSEMNKYAKDDSEVGDVLRDSYMRIIKNSRTKFGGRPKNVDINCSNIETYFTKEELELIDKQSSANKKNVTENNMKNLQAFLNNDLKIQTGCPKENIVTSGTKAQKEFYNNLSRIIPTHFYDNNLENKQVVFQTTRRKRAFMSTTKNTSGVNFVPSKLQSLPYTTNKLITEFEVNHNDSDENIIKHMNEHENNQTRAGELVGQRLNTVNITNVFRDNEGNITSFGYESNSYQVKKRKPKDLYPGQWTKVGEAIGYSGYNVYKSVHSKPDTGGTDIIDLNINVQKNASDNTIIHESVHTFENLCPKLFENEGIIHSVYTQGKTGRNDDGGIMWKDTFEDYYASKIYVSKKFGEDEKVTNYEVFTTSVPRLLEGNDYTDKKVQNAFLGMLALES